MNRDRVKTTRNALYERENGRCFYCDRAVVDRVWLWPQKGHMPDDATLDHIIPRSQGGPFSVENLVLACRTCNEERGTEPADEYLLKKAG